MIDREVTMTSTSIAAQRRAYEAWRYDGPDPATITDVAERGKAWADELGARQQMRGTVIEQLRDYFHGVQKLKFSTEAWRETYGDAFGMVNDNWCRIVVESKTELMQVQGFRFDEDADPQAWEHWQDNRMHVDSDAFHTDLLTTGYAYSLVWKVDDQLEWTVEDPMHTIVVHDPANRRRRLAGMKRWRNRNDSWSCIVFEPQTWWRLDGSDDGVSGWTLADSGANTMGVVPIVEAANATDASGYGVSILEPILGLQDAVNKLLSDEMIVAEHAGYPQRVVLGLEVPEEDKDDETSTLPPILGGPNRWMSFEGDEKLRIQELSTADLGTFQKAIEQLVQHIAAISRTPPHYMVGNVVNVSADALRAAQAGNVSVVRRLSRLAGEAHEEAQRLLFLLGGNAAAAANQRAETIWTNPETPSEAVLVDSLVKLKSLGLPTTMIWERLGLSPEEIDRAEALAIREAQRDSIRFAAGPSGLPAEPDDLA